jgi:hypothetical protein
MDQQTPVVPPVVNPTPAPQVPVPTKSTPVWVWILGGCLGIIILSMVAVGGFTWWAAKKVKQEFKNAQPKLEQWQKDAEKMSKEAEKWQEEVEKMQKELPSIPAE